MIGPLRTDRGSGSIGGTTVSFGILLDYLREHAVPHRVVNTQKYYGGWRNALGMGYALVKTFLLAPRHDVVMVNVAETGTLYAAPLLYLVSKLWRKPFVFRGFGGNLFEVYERASGWHRWVLRYTVLRADLVLLQTKRLVADFGPICPRIDWLPTSRRPWIPTGPRAKFSRRFVFLSQIKETKGIEIILAARQKLERGYVLDVIGPILEIKYEHLRNCDFYKGVLQPEEVIPTLVNYDVLLLPTFHPGEGYPGIVIEANSIGVPVVATRWLALPEVIDDGRSGLLIPTHSIESLVAAIRSFTPINYPQFSQNARTRSEQFNSDKVNQHLLERLHSIANCRLPSAGN